MGLPGCLLVCLLILLLVCFLFNNKYLINDQLTLTEIGQLIISTYNFGAKWPRSQNRKFQHYTLYAKVGQQKINNNQVKCHLFFIAIILNFVNEKKSKSSLTVTL